MARPGPDSALAEFLRAELTARKWSNSRLARACGVSESLVSRWKNGHTVPTANNCTSIAEAFGVEPDYVLRLAGHMPAAGVTDPAADEWAALQREWSSRFDRSVRILTRPIHDDCTQRTVSAWLDAFNLMVNRLSA
jgi:transcriptional regulator with XRE-family HTH domain